MLLRLPNTLLCSLLPLVSSQSISPKRGLVYTGNKHATSDASVWYTNTDLTWYYNYSPDPTPELKNSLHFVPMFWGQTSDAGFKDSISSRKNSGENITYVLGMNEPDMSRKVGGSDLSPSDAAQLWQDEIEPLKALGIKVGAPVVSGSPVGYTWLKQWESACDGKCNPDFMPVHWYGTFDAFASWVGNMTITYPDLDVWVTEFGLPGASAQATKVFLNQSISMLDGWKNVTHYAYFGAVRQDVSNIGPNAAMLTKDGRLTDVGRSYLGPNATGSQTSTGSALSVAPMCMLSMLVSLLLLCSS